MSKITFNLSKAVLLGVGSKFKIKNRSSSWVRGGVREVV